MTPSDDDELAAHYRHDERIESAESGLPYTRENANGDPISEKNDSRQPWTKSVDMKLERTFAVYDRVKASFNVSVSNLFNWTNLTRVDPQTGEARENGVSREYWDDDHNGTYEYYATLEGYTDLTAYQLPRIIELGIELSF